MKTTLVGGLTQESVIDWSKPQLVKSESCIIATTGKHTGINFSGVRIKSLNNHGNYEINYSTIWSKSRFKPCTTPITITFEND